MSSFLLAAFLILQGPPQDGGIAKIQSADEAALPEQVAAVQQPAGQPPQSPGPAVQPVDTKHAPSTGKIILNNIWSDQKAIWTSPLRMNRKDAAWWALFGGGTAALISTDQRTSNVLPNTARQISISRKISRTGAPYTTFPVAGAFYFYGRVKKDSRARETGILGSQALLDSYIMLSILKVAAGRERPDLSGGDGRFFKGKDSFPSGHSMMSWSLASLIAHEYKGGKAVPVIAYSLASVVSASRFAQRKHFASDVAAGGAMGWFIGRYVFQQHMDSSIHKGAGSHVWKRNIPEVYPSLDPLTHTYGLSLAWNQ